jgi:arsenite methyltransferase
LAPGDIREWHAARKELLQYTPMKSRRLDYGLDAPPVVRNLLVEAVLGLGMWLAAVVRIWSGAIRLPLAVGIDLWRAEDLANNAPGAVWANAALEGVADRIAIETADMRALPFADASFDVVLSQAAVHNLSHADDRARALGEIARVLRPGGQLLLADIRHLGEYAAALRARGLDVRIEGSAMARAFLPVITFGALRPGVLRGRRPG